MKALAGALAPLRTAAANKFYVDEVYDVLIIRPFRWLASATFRFIDRLVIDLILVNGSAFAVDVVGRLTRVVQNGDVQRYMGVMLIGAAAILALALPMRGPSFESRGNGPTRTFVADARVGEGGRIEWDFDSDGVADATGTQTEWRFAAAGPYRVIMRVVDSGGAVRQVEKKLVVEGPRLGMDPEVALVGGGK